MATEEQQRAFEESYYSGSFTDQNDVSEETYRVESEESSESVDLSEELLWSR